MYMTFFDRIFVVTNARISYKFANQESKTKSKASSKALKQHYKLL